MEDVFQPEAPKTNGDAGKPEEKKPVETVADKDAKLQKLMLEWANVIADKVIKAVREDVALRFLDDVDDEEAHGSFDLKGEFDPIVDEKTGALVSEVIAEKAAEFQKTEKVLRRVYEIALKKKWAAQKFSIDLDGVKYGKKFLVNRHGVWTRLNAVGGDGPFVWRRIARTQIKPIAWSRDTTQGRNWRCRYCINDETGEFTVEVGKQRLGKKADAAINKLMRHGVHVVESAEARQQLAVFLRYKPKARILRAPRVGWFDANGHWAFVLPTETLGDAGKDAVVLDAITGNHGFDRSGTTAQWLEHVAKPHAHNSNVVLAIGTFLAAPLLRWAGEPGGGFHIFGPSKAGKTLADAIGQSVWGLPYFPGAGADVFGFSWESTANRIGERAVLRSDVGLSLDELGVGDASAIAKTIYTLSGGLGKGRYGQAEQDFNILFFSTGELSLAEFLPDARQGQLVRAVDIPAIVQPESAFENISRDMIEVAGRHFYEATKEFHGSVGYDWLKYLVDLGPKQIKAEIKRLHKAWRALPEVMEIAAQAHPQVVSVVNRFSLIAVTLHMASAADIVPWTVADIDKGIVACMKRWVKQRGNTDAAGELLREVRHRRQMIAATIGDRFVHLKLNGRRLVPASAADKRKQKSREFDGFVKETGKESRILVRPDAWQRWWTGLDADAVKQHLLKAELLIPGRDGVVPNVEKIDRKAQRFYVLTSAFVE